MKRSIVTSLAFVAISLFASAASADYVCQTTYMPGSQAGGYYGFFTVSLYTGPDCSGSYVGYYYFCSSGATSSQCPQSYLPASDAQMSMLVTKVIDATQWNLPVKVPLGNCIGGGYGCPIWFQFN
jgi:hypothetical protein